MVTYRLRVLTLLFSLVTIAGMSPRGSAAEPEWRDWQTGKLLAAELYDHADDPHELANVAAPGDGNLRDEAQRLLHRQFPPDKVPAAR
jgi:hypothetical protein